MLRRLTFWMLLATATITLPLAAEEPATQPPASTPSTPAAPGRRGMLLQRLRERMANGGGTGIGGGRQVDLSKLNTLEWKVGGVTRNALVYVPPGLKPEDKPPLVFVFHGHGGAGKYVAHQLPMFELWPEAVSVYPNGLPTPVPVIDVNGERAGWQKSMGDQGDRDLLFFDEMLKTFKDDYHVDASRVYSTGHSNGAFFTYVLWAARDESLAAIAPVAGNFDQRDFKGQKPKPVLHVAGENDPIVKFSSQERSMARVREVDGCDATGHPAGEFCTEYTSKNGPSVVTFIHPGGHEVPQGAAKRIVQFFHDVEKK